jgi:hypothetical protein
MKKYNVPIRQYYSALSGHINALKKSHRMIIFALLAFLIWEINNTCIYKDLVKEKIAGIKVSQGHKQKIISGRIKIKEMEKSLVEKQKEAEQIVLKKKNRKKLFTDLEMKYISNENFDSILLSMIKSERKLKLKKITNLPKITLRKFKVNGKVFVLRRLGVMIAFQGKYFETIEYIKKLEKLKFPIFWEKFSYNVVKYPKAEIEMKIYILNKKEWGPR